jgi:outer membrane protein OmpA-like peptidoglycan-associated protein
MISNILSMLSVQGFFNTKVMGFVRKEILFMIFLAAGAASTTYAQKYLVEKAAFNADKYDDYSPVYYGDGLVFCSNRKHDVMVVYASEDNIQATSMWYVALGDSAREIPHIFSRELLTNLHDGPATFNKEGNVIYYSRNQDVDAKLKDVFDKQNRLGLFRAERVEGVWTHITPFKFNSPDYSITTPAISPDNQRLYFASDMPGGYGGADLWYCEQGSGEWLTPVNLGPAINSPGNESYPFISPSGVLYFSSDGWKGNGRKDIFFTTETGDGEWVTPVHMEGGINSKADDFGLTTDQNGRYGYFSSDRESRDHIYYYETDVPAFFNCDSLKKNYYCYLFYDEGFMEIDSLPLRYEWNFGDGVKVTGIEAEHCFPGPGSYTVELNIIDNNTGNTFFTQTSYELEITDHIQPFITSEDTYIRDREIHFSGLGSYLPQMDITGYFWDFGDGTTVRGAEVDHLYAKQGTYRVQLGVTGVPDSTGLVPKECVYKVIDILKDNQDLATYRARETGELGPVPESAGIDSANSKKLYALSDVREQEAVFRVELLNSEKPLSIENTVFDPIRGAYEIKEVFLRKDSLYSYTVGETGSVLETYPIYQDVVDRGFTGASVKSYILADLAEEELLQLTSDLAEFDDAYFEFNDYHIGAASYPLLDRVAEILNRYPMIKLEVAAHTDNMGSFEYNMQLSQRRAKSMVDYLVQQGIDPDRLIGKGYGESRPIADNNSEEGRSINRRVEFIILDERE